MLAVFRGFLNLPFECPSDRIQKYTSSSSCLIISPSPHRLAAVPSRLRTA